MDWLQGPDRHSKPLLINLNLDGVRVDIRGGVYSIARDGWHVFNEKVAYHVSGGQAGATETAFHPDSREWLIRDQAQGTRCRSAQH